MSPAALVAIALLCAALPKYWPDHPLPSALPAQIEQETCSSLKSPKCFSPRAELKTSREDGFGLGQITVTAAFNNFNEVKRMQPALAGWAWADRYQPQPQVVALLAMDYNAYRPCRGLMGTPYDALACALSAYNGGLGGFRSDRRLCGNTAGCNPTKWFGNVENTSTKAKTVVKGYGQSFYQINRAYVRNVLITRRDKYVTSMACAKGK